MRVCNLGCQRRALFKLIIRQLPSDDNRLQVNVLEQKVLQDKVIAGFRFLGRFLLMEWCFFCGDRRAYGH